MLAGLICLFCASGAAAAEQPALVPDRAEISIYEEETAKLKYTLVNAEDAGRAEIYWSTSDASVVTVKKGVLTGKNAGTATVTCTAEWPDGTACSCDFEISVLTPVKRVKAGTQKMILYAGGGSATLSYTLEPEEASVTGVHFTSSDSSVATVDETGVVTPLRPGKTTVSVISDDDPTKHASVAVTVRQPVDSIELEQPPAELAKGATARLKVRIWPEDASETQLKWTSSNRSVASVRNNVLEAKNPGTAEIRCIATDGSGAEASFTVEVYPPVKSVRAAPAQAKAFLGHEPLQLTVNVQPANAKYKEVIWSSSDPRIAAVDENGLVTPLNTGKVVITAVSADDPTKKSAVNLTVLRPVSSITLDREEGVQEKGTAVRLKATVLPQDASGRSVLWTSSAPDVAGVSNGTVTAKKPGTAVITATAADGSGVSASYAVRVTQAVTGIRFPTEKAAVSEGKTVTLHPVTEPADATDTRLIWSSDNERVATVDSETGEVTGVSVGVCTVTAAALDGSGKKGSATVTVEPAVPLEAVDFSRQGKNGGLCEFKVTFRSLTKQTPIRTVGYTLAFSYGGRTYTRAFTSHVGPLAPGAVKKSGWQEVGYQLTFAGEYKIYLTSVQFSDGTWVYFEDGVLIGAFD